MYECEELPTTRGVHGGSFLLGIVGGMLMGVVATVAFAAYEEERFRVVVRRTRAIGDTAQDKAEVARDKAVAAVSHVASATRSTVRNATREVAHKVGDIAGDVEKLAKDVRVAVDTESTG